MMNKITINLLGLLLFLTFAGKAQSWVQRTAPNTNNLYGIAFSNASTGFAVGLNSNFIFTTDAGATWNEVSGASTIGEDLWTIEFPSSNYGYVAGTNGMVFRTTNGGNNWSVLTSPTSEDILKLDFISESTGMIVGTSGLAMKTTNSGVNWTTITPSSSYHYSSVCMLNTTTAWIGGSSGKIYKTTNGGISWISQSTGTTESIYDIKFVDANNGFAAATNGRFLKTTNGGINWSTYTIGSYTNHYFRMYFDDANTGWLIGQGGLILKTSNGGNNWSAEQVPQSIAARNLVDITKTGNAMYIVGTTGTILQYNVKSLKLDAPNGGEILAGGGKYNITWTSENIDDIKIEFSTDGGISWNTISSSVSASEGSYSWNVPGITSKSVKLRISDVSDSKIMDESDAYFEIKLVKSLALTKPNGGEKIQMGNITSITWTSQNIQKINIYYSINGGLSWAGVASNIDAASATYSWSVPNVASASAKLKIEAAEDVTVFDESDEYFSVINQTGIEDAAIQNNLSVYPNPSAGSFIIDMKNQNIPAEITVTSVSGKIIYKKAVASFTGNTKVNLPENIRNGIYILNIKSPEINISKKISVLQ